MEVRHGRRGRRCGFREGPRVIEVANIRIPLARLGKTRETERAALVRELSRSLRVDGQRLATGLELRKRSIDARKRDKVSLTYTVRTSLDAAAETRLARQGRDIRIVEDALHTYPSRTAKPLEERPIVVGAGCAGLFCALVLARAGLEPLLIERGDDASRRGAVVAEHNATGALDPDCNIQFGAGGAGTFSDGKLATGTKSASHRFILETFVEGGADPSILFDAHPHVGSDVLPQVVDRIVGMIRKAGGEVRFRTRMTELVRDGSSVRGICVEQDGREEELPSRCVVLATGHSARDVYALLAEDGIPLERKPFAMGVRIEHLQADIDRALYGAAAGHPLLGAAPYKLSCHLDGRRGVFSFCMCPGGYVVSAASEPGGVCTNGMSYSGRAGTNANAGLLVNVFPEDLPGDDVLAGVALQRGCERSAFEAGGGAFVAPAQLVGDYLACVPSSGPGRIQPTYPRGVAWGSIDGCLPGYVTESMRAAIPLLARKLAGFDAADAVLTGVETRSSSPVRITRGDGLASIGCAGLIPVGEGAGYAGGIMSAAADGIRAAEAIIAQSPSGGLTA